MYKKCQRTMFVKMIISQGLIKILIIEVSEVNKNVTI